MKRVIAIILVALVAVGLMACGSKEPELPDGVIAYKDHCYYVIRMMKDQVSTHFDMTGPTNTYVLTFVGEKMSGVTGSMTVEYRKVEQGGWVAYSKAVNKVIYIPPEHSENDVAWIAQKLSGDLSSNMSIEQAKEYISFMH